jgi:hypothetical protein
MSTRVFQILVREGAPLPAFDERAWGGLLAASGIPLEDQVAEFALRRAELVATLRSLTQGRGTAAMEPDEYQPLPASLALEVEEKRKKQLEERRKAK